MTKFFQDKYDSVRWVNLPGLESDTTSGGGRQFWHWLWKSVSHADNLETFHWVELGTGAGTDLQSFRGWNVLFTGSTLFNKKLWVSLKESYDEMHTWKQISIKSWITNPYKENIKCPKTLFQFLDDFWRTSTKLPGTTAPKPGPETEEESATT